MLTVASVWQVAQSGCEWCSQIFVWLRAFLSTSTCLERDHCPLVHLPNSCGVLNGQNMKLTTDLCASDPRHWKTRPRCSSPAHLRMCPILTGVVAVTLARGCHIYRLNCHPSHRQWYQSFPPGGSISNSLGEYHNEASLSLLTSLRLGSVRSDSRCLYHIGMLNTI
jgi:hypothetical protein